MLTYRIPTSYREPKLVPIVTLAFFLRFYVVGNGIVPSFVILLILTPSLVLDILRDHFFVSTRFTIIDISSPINRGTNEVKVVSSIVRGVGTWSPCPPSRLHLSFYYTHRIRP